MTLVARFKDSLVNQTLLSVALNVLRHQRLGTLAVRLWHAEMQSRDIVTRQDVLNTASMLDIQICTCVVCTHTPEYAYLQ